MKVSATLGVLLAGSLGLSAADEPASQKAQIESLHACLAESNKRVAVLRDALQAPKDQSARLALFEDALLKVTRQKSQLEEQLVSQNSQLASYANRPDIDRDQWVAVNRKVLTLETELDTRDAALTQSKATLGTVQDALDQLTTKHAEQSNAFASLSDGNTRLENRLKTLTDSHNRLQQEHNQSIKRADDAEQTAAEGNEELEETKAALALANKRATDAQQAQKQSADLVSVAQKAYQEADGELAAAKQSLATAIEDLEAGSKSRDALTAQVSTLQEHLKAATDELQDKEGAITDRDAKTAKAMGDLKMAQEAFRKVEAEKLEREASLLERSTALQSAQRDITTWKTQFAALERSLEKERLNSADKTKLQQDLDALRANRSDDIEKLAVLHKEREAHDQELQRSRKELEQWKQQLAELQNQEISWQQTRVQILAQKSQLEQQLTAAQQTSSQMQRQLLRIDPIHYALNSANIDREQARVRDQVRTILTIFPNAIFEISGHTCTLGSAERNKTLSEQRAKRLLDFLVSDGVATDQLSSAGYGEERPVADNETDAGRRQNRRVEIKVQLSDGTSLLNTEGDATLEVPQKPNEG